MRRRNASSCPGFRNKYHHSYTRNRHVHEYFITIHLYRRNRFLPVFVPTTVDDVEAKIFNSDSIRSGKWKLFAVIQIFPKKKESGTRSDLVKWKFRNALVERYRSPPELLVTIAILQECVLANVDCFQIWYVI